MDNLDKQFEKIRETWRGKVIAETRGRSTRLGCVIIAALGFNRVNRYPRFGSKAFIDQDGRIIAYYYPGPPMPANPAVIADTLGFSGDLRRVADKCKLSDQDRIEFFEAMKNWIERDLRAKVQLPFGQST